MSEYGKPYEEPEQRLERYEIPGRINTVRITKEWVAPDGRVYKPNRDYSMNDHLALMVIEADVGGVSAWGRGVED